MNYYAQDHYDTEADTTTLLQRSSTSSSVFKRVIDGENDDGKTCTGRSCCRHQERQIATPRTFSANDDCVDWLQDFEEIARANNWSSKVKLDIIPVYLEGKAVKTWFRDNQQEWGDFDSFKLAFDTRFKKDSSGQPVDAEVRKEQQQQRLWNLLGYLIVVSLPLVVSAIIFGLVRAILN
ncbi:hypothetical protein KVV02_004908 [Mortierella alpina]|uniref:Uncharacterized protein n=1 Tax=Mortierella alpina TaxID=64518 RepID=A0A9P8CUY1_MORAP|nr:hypothetical protein KVV02_004908 [Mortierella alpina]